MKKRSYAFIAFTMCIILLAGLTSCGNRNEKNTKNGMNDTSSENVTSAAGEALSEDTDGSVPSEAADPEKTEEKEQNVQENVPSQTEATGNAGVQTGTETDAGLLSGSSAETDGNTVTEAGSGDISDAPTPSVTKAPEGGITNVPSKTPAVEAPKVTAGSVTGTPEKNPSSSVTETPAKEPTKEPVKTPTKEPTKAPTKDPAKDPTKAPEKTPTKEPTKTPVKEPTKEPTKEPAKTPTKEPTTAPTKEPAKTPTKEPTKAPAKAEKIGDVLGYRTFTIPVYLNSDKELSNAEQRIVILRDEKRHLLATKSMQTNTLVFYEFYHDDPAKGYPYITSHVPGITVEGIKETLDAGFDMFNIFIACCAEIGETYGTDSRFNYQIGTQKVKKLCIVGDMYSDGTVKAYSEPEYDGMLASMASGYADNEKQLNEWGHYFEDKTTASTLAKKGSWFYDGDYVLD